MAELNDVHHLVRYSSLMILYKQEKLTLALKRGDDP